VPHQLGKILSRAQRTIGRVKRLLCLLVMGTACLLTSFATPALVHAADKPSMFVYLPTDVRPNAFQKMLNSAIPTVNVTVFGRVKDFQKNIKKQPPDAILSYRPVIDNETGISVGLQGLDKGSPNESFVLISVGKTVEIQAETQLTIGIVDLLGRKKMANFVSKMIQTSKKPKIKRVSKPEDLLSLLQFKVADAVLIPEKDVKAFKSKSKLDLKVTPISGAKVGLPALGFLSDTNKKLIQSAVKKLQGKVQDIMRVSSWRAL
jgi:hypothetical protein